MMSRIMYLWGHHVSQMDLRDPKTKTELNILFQDCMTTIHSRYTISHMRLLLLHEQIPS